jgi:ADP-ribose pyrophosphatase YjhB (NUDIX family)
MSPGLIQPLVIAIIRRGEGILVSETADLSKGEVFYRPLGGRVEFGERAEEALRRELREELGAELKGLRYLDALENIFVYEGEQGHEIVLVYEARLADPALYRQDALEGYEQDVDQHFRVVWKRLDEFGPGRLVLYPDGLLDLLNGRPPLRSG